MKIQLEPPIIYILFVDFFQCETLIMYIKKKYYIVNSIVGSNKNKYFQQYKCSVLFSEFLAKIRNNESKGVSIQN